MESERHICVRDTYLVSERFLQERERETERLTEEERESCRKSEENQLGERESLCNPNQELSQQILTTNSVQPSM